MGRISRRPRHIAVKKPRHLPIKLTLQVGQMTVRLASCDHPRVAPSLRLIPRNTAVAASPKCTTLAPVLVSARLSLAGFT